MNAEDTAIISRTFPGLTADTPFTCENKECGYQGKTQELRVAMRMRNGNLRELSCPKCGHLVGNAVPHTW